MKKKLTILLEVLLVIVFLWSSSKIYAYYKDNKSYAALNGDYTRQKEEIYKALNDKGAQEVGGISEGLPSEVSEEDREIQGSLAFVETLHDEYPQVIGRIQIENLDIDFPLVQGQDNSYYLDHDYTGAYHPFGAVFMDVRNGADFEDQNTVLYGHNVRSGHVFNALNAYRDPSYVREYPYIIIDTLEGRRIYEIFAVYDANEYEDYRTSQYVNEAWDEFFQRVDSKNLLGETVVNEEDQILTLSTCSDVDDRMVIHGKLVEKRP